MTLRKTLAALGGILTLSALLGAAAPARAVELVGLNLSGAGFASQVLPGLNERNYIFPVEAYFQQWSARGVKLVRFPIIWERLQPSLGGAFDPTYAGLIDRTFLYAQNHGIKIILDLHNYMRYRGTVIGTGSVGYNHYQDVLTRIAQRWSSQASLYGYDIMNEPHDATAQWPVAAQYGINGVRSVDNVRPIFIEGNGWAEATRWPQWNDSLLALRDPANNLIFSAHTYFDGDGGGGNYANTSAAAYPDDYGVQRVRPFVEWLKKNGKRGFIGEFGVPDSDPRWNVIMDNMLAYLKQNCIPATYWAAGPGWANYNMSVEPVNGQTRPQWPTLAKYLDGSSCSSFGPGAQAPKSATQADLNGIQQLYLAYMGRASDLAGLQYWANRVASGEMNVAQIAASFTESPEYRGQYQGLDNAALVSKVYTNVIGRSAETAGLNYWVGELNNGNVKPQTLVLAMVRGLGDSDKSNFDARTSAAFSNMK
ncbi:cellulase family glycosylhydrolase [Pseudomonas oryzihabitans]|uniref:cellulase family glycosylhydrolase n=1 Tax=Pseudomonas oryzihabitans TaxID=47885 RepID=UPI003CF8642E